MFPSKMGPFAPFLAMPQPLSSARAFLLGENEQELLCMGRTFTANKPLPLNNSPKGKVRVEPHGISKVYHWDGQTLCPRTDCFKA
jgi:hypothetical protein